MPATDTEASELRKGSVNQQRQDTLSLAVVGLAVNKRNPKCKSGASDAPRLLKI
jgi:hypothetical protein